MEQIFHRKKIVNDKKGENIFRAQQYTVSHVVKINWLCLLWQRDKNEFEFRSMFELWSIKAFKNISTEEYKSLPGLGKPKMADLGTLYTYGKVAPLEVLGEVWSYSVGLEVSELEKMLIHMRRMGFWSLAT